jgi:hypothetical protein
MHEFRHAIGRLVPTPGFTAAVVLTLALVVGASAAIFTLVERVVLAPLPYPVATLLVVLDHAAPGIGVASQFGMSRGIAREYAAIDGVEALALYQPGIDVTIAAGGEPARVRVMRVSPSFSTVFGFHPTHGRWFTDDDSRLNAPQVAILAHRLAEQLYRDAAGTLSGRPGGAATDGPTPPGPDRRALQVPPGDRSPPGPLDSASCSGGLPRRQMRATSRPSDPRSPTTGRTSRRAAARSTSRGSLR